MPVPSEIFGDDYVYFYGGLFGGERSDPEAEAIARLLSLEPGMRVLDAPCGEGRIAGRLAARGAEVVGVDIEDRFLALAREQYPAVVFEHCDIRSLPYRAEFDAVVNWFTSFGYFDPETNDAVLAGFARALKPGGRLVIEFHNPWRLRRLVELAGGASANMIERDGDLVVDRVTYDCVAGRSLTERFSVRRGRVRKLEFSLEQVPAPALVRRLRHAGFSAVDLFAQGGARFEPEGRRVIAVARVGPADTAEPPVSLREMTADNVGAVCDLSLAPGQERYAAPAAHTLAEAQFDPRGWVRAIYAGEQPVGLLALIADAPAARYELVRLMIGAEHQGRGYGRAAIGLLAEHVRSLPGARELLAAYIPGPEDPSGFYAALGFRDTGRIEHGEAMVALAL
jgi:SAM-dependent methyltransferase